MNDIIIIALKAFPVIALITTGVVLEKTAFIGADVVKGMKKLIMNLALPCLLFLILLDADLQTDYLWGSVAVFLTCLVALAMGFLFKKNVAVVQCVLPGSLFQLRHRHHRLSALHLHFRRRAPVQIGDPRYRQSNIHLHRARDFFG